MQGVTERCDDSAKWRPFKSLAIYAHINGIGRMFVCPNGLRFVMPENSWKWSFFEKCDLKFSIALLGRIGGIIKMQRAS